MSTISSMGPDSLVTIKINHDGINRKVKMVLREMVPKVLEEQIRRFLQLPADAQMMIERYSDSAAAYVLLDSTNMAVYKQLYRAAKAKSKLKLRVSLIGAENKTIPKPVSVEEVPEDASKAVIKEASTTSLPSQSVPKSLPLRNISFQKSYDASLLKEAANLATNDGLRDEFNNRLSRLMDCNTLYGNFTSCQSALANSSPPAPNFAVCCNSCNKTVPDAHYHCSTCDDGDFDLCQSCIDQGITCYSDNHWLIKRTVVDGVLVKSSTETIAQKPKSETIKAQPNKQLPPPVSVVPFTSPGISNFMGRTCNSCLQDLPEVQFLHCDTCADFDLCQPCFASDAHGHHPMHGFAPAVPGSKMPDHITVKMAPGRNKMHLAICDGCEKNIAGVRHKCLDCPDWDYCTDCVQNAGLVHPNHRFAPVYEPLSELHACVSNQPVHMGICCDGPLCNTVGWPAYIKGIRYKCAVCHDLDFCANCEASPANEHNKTHPLIKFKTPVRHVSVTTTGEHHDGKQMALMGDRSPTSSRSNSVANNSVNPVQTVVDLKPEEPVIMKEEKLPEYELQVKAPQKTTVSQKPIFATSESSKSEKLDAVFVRDSVADGTILAPNHVFEQTWTLRNNGNISWPAGCAVKFIGGDYMGHVDSAHPAGISELVSASKSTVCYSSLAPGQEFPFTVLLRSPARPGKFVSYWRLTSEDGERFGHRLWCEINVRIVKTEAKPRSTTAVEELRKDEESATDSIMIFPKLEKESPSTSVHEELQSQVSRPDAPSVNSGAFEAAPEEEDWDATDDGFMTDEEYDILDASDEEYLEEQHKKTLSN